MLPELDPLANKIETPGEPEKEVGFFRGALGNKKFLSGLIILAAFTVMGILGQFIAPYSPYNTTFQSWLPPSSAHLLGTDYIGHDVFSRYVIGTGTSLFVGASVSLITTFLGTMFGLVSGYYGGAVDNLVMRSVDILLILPTFPLLVILSVYLPPTNGTTIMILGLLSWPFMSRVIRSQVLTLKERPFIKAAKLSGYSGGRIIFKEIFPHLLPLIVINAVYVVVGAIVAQAGLSFFGLGNLASVNWGTSLYWAQTSDAILYNAWWWIVPPGLSIALIGVASNLFGSGLNEYVGQRSGEVR